MRMMGLYWLFFLLQKMEIRFFNDYVFIGNIS